MCCMEICSALVMHSFNTKIQISPYFSSLPIPSPLIMSAMELFHVIRTDMISELIRNIAPSNISCQGLDFLEVVLGIYI